MILKRRKYAQVPLIVLIFFFAMTSITIFASKKYSIQVVRANIEQKIMTLDHGYSTITNLRNASPIHDLPIVLPKQMYKSASLKLSNFPNRPNIQSINIDVKFENYKLILEDRKRFLTDGALSNPISVPAEIRYDGKVYKSKIRLKGDFPDHWRSIFRMSFRVDLKDGTIFGMKRFSIQKPASRQHPYDQT